MDGRYQRAMDVTGLSEPERGIYLAGRASRRYFAAVALVMLTAGSGRADPVSIPSDPPATTARHSSADVPTSNAPVDITSDDAHVLQLQHLRIFKGNVEVIKENARMRTPELHV